MRPIYPAIHTECAFCFGHTECVFCVGDDVALLLRISCESVLVSQSSEAAAEPVCSSRVILALMIALAYGSNADGHSTNCTRQAVRHRAAIASRSAPSQCDAIGRLVVLQTGGT